MKFWLILFIISIIFNIYISKWISYLFIAYMIYKILSDLHIIGTTKFSKGANRESDLFYLCFTGPYSQSFKNCGKISEVFNKFKLENKYETTMFGLYFDNPKKIPEDQCRYALGIMVGKTEKNAELEDYLISQNWLKASIPSTTCIVSRFSVVHLAASFLVYKRFYKDFDRSICDENFLKQFQLNLDKLPGIMEIYRKDMIEFRVPLSNEESFKIYKSE